jgi:chemotaxis regulatin CheY-phosphate phosphatase CheZ
MNDTPQQILQKQLEIIHAKPLRERLQGVFEMTELSRNIILNQLRQTSPDLSEIDLKVELFKIVYRSDFDDETLNKIAEEMKRFLLKEPPEIIVFKL